MSRVIVLLLPRSQYVPHPTPHVPLLASWRSISWSSNCDALFEIIHIIRCKSFVCYQVLCFSQEQIGRGHVYIEYTQKVPKVLLLSTPKKYCAGKMRIHYFSGQFFFCMMYKQNWSLRPVARIMCPCSNPLGTDFPEGNLVNVYMISFLYIFGQQFFCLGLSMGCSELELLGQIASFERRLRGASPTPLAMRFPFRTST